MRIVPPNRRSALASWKRGPYALAATLVLALPIGVGVAGPAHAAVRTEIPSEDPGPPFYARVERQAVHTEIVPHTDDWAVVVFYRSPSCVPDDFNLMDLFDPPAAFACGLTIEGFELWRNGPPPIDLIPMFAQFHGLGAVPIWFVDWPELQSAVADDVLTMPELLALPSLRMGSASFFRERLHPTGGAENPRLNITAHGWLDDGAAFQLEHSGNVGRIQTRIRISD